MNIQHVNRSHVLYRLYTFRRQKTFHRETWPILVQNLKKNATEKKAKEFENQ